MRIHWWLMPALLAHGIAAPAAETGGYPSRPIRMVLTAGPGSTTDNVGRMVFAGTAERLGQQFVVDNRPGAGGIIGMEIVARAVPDGYTLAGIAAGVLTISPHVYRKLGYDPLRDFVPVGVFIKAQTALCVHSKTPPRSVAEFTRLAREKPGELNMASAGIGSTSHLGGILLTKLAGISANHVPYKGGSSMAAVARGESDFTVGPLSAAMPHVKAGRIRCLATGSDRRSALTPELPTLAESGVPGFRLYGWNGVVAPRGTPQTVIATLNRAMNAALSSAEMQRRFLGLGEEPATGTPEELGKLIREDYDSMGKLVKEAGIRPE